MGMSSTRLTLFVTCLLVLASCGSSSPVPESIFLSGNVTYQGSQTHSLLLSDSGIVEIDVISLTPQLVDITNLPILDLFLGLGIGRLSEGNCVPTTQTAVRAGDRVVYGLSDVDYCIRLFDAGSLPEDATVRYALEISSD
jgi:hypothetical protein